MRVLLLLFTLFFSYTLISYFHIFFYVYDPERMSIKRYARRQKDYYYYDSEIERLVSRKVHRHTEIYQ